MEITQLQMTFTSACAQASSVKALDEVRVDFLGKKGLLTEAMKALGAMNPEERKAYGQKLNTLRATIEADLSAQKEKFQERELSQRLVTEAVDITLPVDGAHEGKLHPFSQGMHEALHIFSGMGFEVVEGPDIETDYNNFTALNIPESHPARQMQDTFYLNGCDEKGLPLVLRTQTSPVQIRTMTGKAPPFKIVVPGRTYRSDSDATHTPNFHQIEGLYVDKGIHMGHLKATLYDFFRHFFAVENLTIRFRPSYFPFTEPSAEMDVNCTRDKGIVRLGVGTDWLEVLGCGMVHPHVLRQCGVDPDEYQGFAFGMGVERITMLKYGMSDLRAFFDGDSRWSDHYGFSASRSFHWAKW
ncbi:MAG: phenylalanine--tRNA ligase subunit alpha [Alphaproteobacteria bacterium]|nr:MAG: phenylalanine--tRNA ligase subunit alpha [Alphaproteobacteria bacterium]